MHGFDEAALLFLGLARLKGVGFKTLRDLGGVDATAQKLMSEGPSFVAALTRGEYENYSISEVQALGEEIAEILHSRGINLVRACEPHFPLQFTELEPSLRPLWFFYRGNYGLLATEAIAVVGTRTPSREGEFLTKYAVAAVQEIGATVVSGLAKGIDEIAHEAALACNVANVSILGNGLLRSYPAKNAELAQRIVEAGGLLISEYMPYAMPTGEAFVWRNRLQAALAKCVVAPEWKRSSGTAHTVRFAKRFERPSINLTINGVASFADQGRADQTYEVPRQHAAFINALQIVDRYTEARLLSVHHQRLLF